MGVWKTPRRAPSVLRSLWTYFGFSDKKVPKCYLSGRLLVEYVETEHWPIPRAFFERCSSVSRAFLERFFERFLAVFGHASTNFSAAALHSALPSPPFVAPLVLVR